MSVVMHQIKRRVARSAIFFLVAVLAMLPVAAIAAPSVAAGDSAPTISRYKEKGASTSNAGGQGSEESEDKGKGSEESEDKGKGSEESEDKGKEAEESEDKGKEAEESEESEGKGQGHARAADWGQEDDDGPGSSDGHALGHVDDGDGDEDDVVVSVAIGPPSGVPSGVVPTNRGRPVQAGPPAVVVPAPAVPRGTPPVGFSAVDVDVLPAHLGAAIVMFDDFGPDFDAATVEAVQVSGEDGSAPVEPVLVLSPVLPPALTHAASAPVVVFEALVKAMASSGQALVIPFLAGAVGFFAPGLRRRRNLLAEALGDRELPAA